MAFFVAKVEFDDFRNHRTLSLDLEPNLNIIVGDNAVGKTNVIEALYFLTTGESFKGASAEDVVTWGAERSRISLRAPGDGRELDMEVAFDGRRYLKVNGKAKRLGEYKGIYPSVLFTPDDLKMIKGPAEVRRRMLDDIGVQLSRGYYQIKHDYEKIVSQRNSLLKDETVPEELLASWTDSLVNIGARFYIHRTNLYHKVKREYLEIYPNLNADNEVALEYLPSWNRYGYEDEDSIEQAFRSALEDARREESARGISLVGPHRDEIVFRIDGKDARIFGSQGQQRLLTLTWKLAEVNVIEEVLGKKPLLLLDDVMSEFDDMKRKMLIDYIDGDLQTVITTTTLDYFSSDLLRNANIIEFS